MARILAKALLVFTALGVVVAKCADSIVSDLGAIEYLFARLDAAINEFRPDCRGLGRGHCHNFITLNHIYKLNSQIENKMTCAIESVQCSCDFTFKDTCKIVDALAGVNKPVRASLRHYRCRKPSFEAAYGPFVTSKVLGHSLKLNRSLVIELLRLVEHKADCSYKKLLRAASLELDNNFRNTIAMY